MKKGPQTLNWGNAGRAQELAYSRQTGEYVSLTNRELRASEEGKTCPGSDPSMACQVMKDQDGGIAERAR